MLTRSQATLFRRWTLGEPESLEPPTSRGPGAVRPDRGPTAPLLRIAALVAMDAGIPAYQREVNAALAAGASVDDIVAILGAITSVIGSAHVMSAAPRLALALGYDVDADLELLSTDRG